MFRIPAALPGVLFVAPTSGIYTIVIESLNAFPAARAFDIRIEAA